GDIKANANIIKRTLHNFGIVVELDEISIGPSVTRYAIKPAEGVRLQKIVALQQNLALALAAKGGIRIEAPIPGKALVGIEVPNSAKVTVGLGTLLESKEFAETHKSLHLALGRDIAGGSHFASLAKMPHILIAGSTGSGKSVAIHTMITSLLYRSGPSQLRFIFIDPKRVELTLYRSLPHLLTPVITDAKRAIAALRWAGKEMERRYNILEEKHVRDVESYHQNVLAPALERLRKQGGTPTEGEEVPGAMPYIVIVIDELADIMQTFPRELEAAVVRLAQMSRAVGIHLVLSTQRPSVNVITGLIKANIPARVALQVASQVDSRTILDQGGAETLLGAGDMLYLSAEMNKPVRLQSAYISEGEVKKIVEFIAKNNEVEMPIDIGGGAPNDGTPSTPLAMSSGAFNDEGEIDDDMYEAARTAVIEAGKASTSYIQRKLRVGYARAARLVDMLEERGVVGPADGAKPREILNKTPIPDIPAEGPPTS
ncbi:MAG: DNA translocase FtsK, partial [Patescibacteria group bacterium]|nr:DNA translocase FtsK [Patescibacteria group bacterium]